MVPGSTILSLLSDHEAGNGIKVLLACEVGSRAQGTSRPDSDHDIRGIFVRPVEAYLSLNSPEENLRFRHVDVDFHLADLRWFLSNIIRNNPSALCMLASSEFHVADAQLLETVRTLHRHVFDPLEAAYHLANLSRKSYGRMTQAGSVEPSRHLAHPVRLLAMLDIVEREGRFPAMDEIAFVPVVGELIGRLRHETSAIADPTSDSVRDARIFIDSHLSTERRRPMIVRDEAVALADRIFTDIVLAPVRTMSDEPTVSANMR